MPPSRLCWALALAFLLPPGTARAAAWSPPSLGHILRTASGPVIPAAWAGVWSFKDTTRNCNTHEILSATSGNDTLCTGGAFSDTVQGGIQFTCTGNATDTQFDVTCTGSETIPPCTVDIQVHITGTMSGDVARIQGQITTTYSGTGCPVPDQCTDLSDVYTRIGPPPNPCDTTPVKPTTWGRLKMIYR